MVNPPRFLFDVMLARLCRYVRAAGYDATLAQDDERDRDLIARANTEGRWLVTRDSLMKTHKAAAKCLVLLMENTVDAQALELGRRFQLDWLTHAFTRCLLDNALLIPAEDGSQADVPQGLQPVGPLLRCPHCGRLYWEGSHVRRMRNKLSKWQADKARARS